MESYRISIGKARDGLFGYAMWLICYVEQKA
jgi:hypothetical protein